MTFTITYRQPTGTLGKEVVEAATRAEALKQARSRGKRGCKAHLD